MNRISFLNRGYAFKGLLAVGLHGPKYIFIFYVFFFFFFFFFFISISVMSLNCSCIYL